MTNGHQRSQFARRIELRGRILLVRFTGCDLAPQMPLLIIQILQVKMQPINFLSRLGRALLGASDLNDGIAVEAPQLRQVGVQQLLLFRQLKLYVMRKGL